MIEFEFKQDNILITLLSIIHLLAIVSVWTWPVMAWIQVICTLMILISAIFSIRHHALKQSSKVVRGFRYNVRQNQAHCYLNHQWRAVKLHGRSVLTNWLIALDCIDSESKARYKVIIWARYIEPKIYRTLIKALKLGRHHDTSKY